MLPGRIFSLFKSQKTSVLFPLPLLRRKVSRSKGNPFIQILEFCTPRPKLKTQNLNFKLHCCEILRWHLGINTFWRQLGSLLEFSSQYLGNNSVWIQIGSPLGFAIPGDSFSRIPPCSPPLVFTFLIRQCGTKYFPVGDLLYFSFLDELQPLPLAQPPQYILWIPHTINHRLFIIIQRGLTLLYYPRMTLRVNIWVPFFFPQFWIKGYKDLYVGIVNLLRHLEL